MSKLSNLLVYINKSGQVEVKDFGKAKNIPESAVQLDELLYNLIDDGVLSKDELKALADRTTAFAMFHIAK